MSGRKGWLDLASGAAGDMLLGALHAVGALDTVWVKQLGLPSVSLRFSPVDRAGLRAMRAHVECPDAQPHRTLTDIRPLLQRADLPSPARDRALAVFERLARAEGRVHGIDPETVHFHEVGAVDAIVDVIGVCLGFAHLGLDALHATPVALGGGTVKAQHGHLPVPAPAVLELLAEAGIPAHGGPVDLELCTPTGAALLAEWVTAWGPMPSLTVEKIGMGAGAKDLPNRPNVLRLILGHTNRQDPLTQAKSPVPEPPSTAEGLAPPSAPEGPALSTVSESPVPAPPSATEGLAPPSAPESLAPPSAPEGPTLPTVSESPALSAVADGLGLPVEEAVVVEANVDDLDPRLWSDVLARLLSAGAVDAWLVPILMKKGRPAHTVRVMLPTDRPETADAVRRVLFTETTTIGLREHVVSKRALPRSTEIVQIAGHPVRIKVAYLDGRPVNLQPEYADVVAAATATGRAIKDLLAEASSAAWRLETTRDAKAITSNDQEGSTA